MREFKLGEGVDRSGVSTKILSCNCSINLGILNKSKFFRLHIHPPLIHMSFTVLPFAFSHVRPPPFFTLYIFFIFFNSGRAHDTPLLLFIKQFRNISHRRRKTLNIIKYLLKKLLIYPCLLILTIYTT